MVRINRRLLLYILLFNINIIYAEDFVLGKSFTGLDINGYSFGEGKNCIVVIGGIHGRYEANTIQITKNLITYCRKIEHQLSSTVKIIYNLNPDGFIYETDDPKVKNNGSLIRFNGNGVDLNRNWEVPDWRADVTYALKDLRTGAGGREPMSEPEVQHLSLLLKQLKESCGKIYIIMLHSYILNKKEKGDVFPSYRYNSNNELELNADSIKLSENFTQNGNFALVEKFYFYSVPGEFMHWCGINNIAAIDIELNNNDDINIIQNNKKTHWGCFIEGFNNLLQNINGNP